MTNSHPIRQPDRLALIELRFLLYVLFICQMRLAILLFCIAATKAHWLSVSVHVVAMLFPSGALELNLKAQFTELRFLCLQIEPG